jgi:hypothetical protein
MARAVLKTKGPTWKERPRPAVAILECGGSHAEGTAVTSESAERWSGQAGQSLAPKSHGLRPLATSEGRLVAALDKALEAIAPPAFVITCDGEILRSNAPARLLLAQEGEAVGQSLAHAISHDTADTTWDLAPLGNEGDPAPSLEIDYSPDRGAGPRRQGIYQRLDRRRAHDRQGHGRVSLVGHFRQGRRQQSSHTHRSNARSPMNRAGHSRTRPV